MKALLPERLNLAVARRCFVACTGCYQNFGRAEPDYGVLLPSVARFVELGIRAATVSGGDPLTLRDLPGFLRGLRAAGVADLKLDTVGVTLRGDSVGALLEMVDWLGLPLDGARNETIGLFRAGRPRLFDETQALLAAIDARGGRAQVVINTVVHAHNLRELPAIGDRLARHPSVVHWNLFQYTPTDQSREQANRWFALDERAFLDACASVREGIAAGRFTIAARTIRSRLGQYLLINSDGRAWLPDAAGTTVELGAVAGREEELLAEWSRAVHAVRAAARFRAHAPAEATLAALATPQ